jgi:riboflavin biosynthesis pyrimidine reductase
MHMSIDGVVASASGESGWMTWSRGPELDAFMIDELIDTGKPILLGRNMTEGFVKHWQSRPAANAQRRERRARP